MTNSELTYKKWDNHLALFHLKEFINAKEVYLNGKPLKWYHIFKKGDLIEVIDKPQGIFALIGALMLPFTSLGIEGAAAVSTAVLIGVGIATSALAIGLVAGGLALVSNVFNRGGNTSTQHKEYSSTTQPELRGASNDISNNIVPVVFGKTQQTPSYAQTPYRLVYDGTGENKYRQYFIPNYSNVVYSDFKLGETAMSNYIASYYSINTASASNTFIGFENCKAITIDEELSYDKAGDVNQSFNDSIGESVLFRNTYILVLLDLYFYHLPNLTNFSEKQFTITITGLDSNNEEVIQTINTSISKTNSTLQPTTGQPYDYTGSTSNVSLVSDMTYITSISVICASDTRNSKTEKNNGLDITLHAVRIYKYSSSYSKIIIADVPLNKYTGTQSEVLQTSPTNTTEVDVILSFPQGLYKLTSSATRRKRSQTVEIMYKSVSEGVWHNIGDANALYIRDLDGVKHTLSTSTTTVSGSNVTVTSPDDLNTADQLFFRPIGFELPSGQYNIRVRNAEFSDKTNYDVGVPNCAEIQFRCTGDVVNPTVLPLTNQIAFEVKAYKGLSGTLKKFNYIAEAKIPTWNGSNWNTIAKSSNPAAIIRYLLTDKAVNPRAESVNHIDNDSLVEYYNWCETVGYKADGIVSEACKIGEIINAILQNSQTAMIPLYNGKHTFAIDKANKIPVGLFNMHNSWNFKWTPNVGRQTEAIRASFVENADWTEDELTLYWYNGQVNDTPEVGKSDLDYEMVKKEYKYVCDRASVRQIVAYELETIQTKRNQFEFDVNLEAMNMMLLDRIYISNTANMQNESTGLIKSVILENGNLTGFELYADVDIPENAKIVIRSLDYTNQKAIIKIYDVINSGMDYIVNINPVAYDGIVKGAGDITGIQDTWHYDGDLFTLGQDTIYDCTVTDIKYNDDGTATITARDYGFTT